MTNLVTVIIPVFNSSDTLVRCLDSICGQTYPNLDIVVIDNNSSDSSYALCKQYAIFDRRVKVLSEMKPGPGAARNCGLRAGKGDYVCFVDSDDLLYPSAIEMALYNINTAEMCLYDFEDLDPNAKRGRAQFLRTPKQGTVNDLFEQMDPYDLDTVIAVPWNKLFRYSIIREHKVYFPEHRTQGEDFAFVLQYMEYVNHIAALAEKLYGKDIPHLTATQENAYNFVPLVKDYWGDVQKLQAKKDLSVLAYEKLYEILAGKLILTVIRINHPGVHLSRKSKRRVLRELVQFANIEHVLAYYHPQEGQSKIIPFFIKLNAIFALELLGRYKAWYTYSFKRGVHHKN